MRYVTVTAEVDVYLDEVLDNDTVVNYINNLIPSERLRIMQDIQGGADGNVEALLDTLNKFGLIDMLKQLAEIARQLGNGQDYVVLRLIKELS